MPARSTSRDGVVVGTATDRLRLVTVARGQGPMAAASAGERARLEPHERLGV